MEYKESYMHLNIHNNVMFNGNLILVNLVNRIMKIFVF